MRKGVLSDQSIKMHAPEYHPLDIGKQDLIDNVHLQKNIFHGIKVPQKVKKSKVSRFPINDLKNFAQFAVPKNAIQASHESIQNYRNQLGSKNYSSHLQMNYQAKTAPHIPPLPRKHTEQQQPPIATATASVSFDKLHPDEGSILSHRIKKTIERVVEPDEYLQMFNTIYPGGVPRLGKLSDTEILSKINKEYRTDKDQLQHVERAYHEAGTELLINQMPFGLFAEDIIR